MGGAKVRPPAFVSGFAIDDRQLDNSAFPAEVAADWSANSSRRVRRGWLAGTEAYWLAAYALLGHG